MKKSIKHAEFSKEVSFVDANGTKHVVTIELSHRNGYDELSLCGESGQCQGQIVAANEAQEQLLQLWAAWHLNGMHAGTVEQEAALKSEECAVFKNGMREQIAIARDLIKNGDSGKTRVRHGERGWTAAELVEMDSEYSLSCVYLGQVANLLTVPHPETGEPYKYGSAWLLRELPEDITEQVDNIIEAIEEAEEERKSGAKLSEMSEADALEAVEHYTNFASGRDAELCLALALMNDLTVDELDSIEIDDNRCTVQGVDYLAGTDDEMDEEWDADLDNYLEECVYPELPETAKRYFDDDAWKKDARMDGRAHSLGRYNGEEESKTVNGTEYFAYRQ